MSAKDAKQQRDKFTALGLIVTRTGKDHYVVHDARGNFLATMGSTPSDCKAVVNVDKQVSRALRRLEEADAAATAPDQDIAPAVPGEDEAPPPGMTREQRRAIQAEIDRREAQIEAKVRDKDKRKQRPAKPAPKPLSEWVRPKSTRVGSLDDHVTTGPDGRKKVFSARVMDGDAVLRTDIIDAEEFAAGTNRHRRCCNCFGPASFILQYAALSYLEIRSLYLALGFPLAKANAYIREDLRRGAGGMQVRADGEVTGGAEVILCQRCYDRAGLEAKLPPDGMREVGERGLRPLGNHVRPRAAAPAPAAPGFRLPPTPAAGLREPLQAGLPGEPPPPPAGPPVPPAFARRRPRTPPSGHRGLGAPLQP